MYDRQVLVVGVRVSVFLREKKQSDSQAPGESFSLTFSFFSPPPGQL